MSYKGNNTKIVNRGNTKIDFRTKTIKFVKQVKKTKKK